MQSQSVHIFVVVALLSIRPMAEVQKLLCRVFADEVCSTRCAFQVDKESTGSENTVNERVTLFWP
jgi:hypothetical protein